MLINMGWATKYIEQLSRGETVQFRPRGNSMSGKIENGQRVTVAPLRNHNIEVGSIGMFLDLRCYLSWHFVVGPIMKKAAC